MGISPRYREAALQMGRLLAQRKIGLVYGGGNVGLMGVAANAALEAGGEVLGVIPRHMEERELAHRGLTELHIVGSMHERKALMANLSDAFVALPGGLGTLDEMFEVATWNQIGIQAKPIGFLNVDGYFDLLLQFLQRAHEQGFVSQELEAYTTIAGDAPSLLGKLQAYPSRAPVNPRPSP